MHKVYARNKMRKYARVLVLLLTALPWSLQEPPCPEGLRLDLPEAQLLTNNSLLAEGIIYPEGNFWHNETADLYIGCPCNVTRCVRMCSSEHINGTNNNSYISGETFNNKELTLQILDENTLVHVTVGKHFVVVSGDTCKDVIVLEPEVDERDNFTILSNGSLNSSLGILDADQFCLLSQEASNYQVRVCYYPNPLNSNDLRYYIYPAFLLVSVVFLALTLATFVMSADEARNHYQYSLTLYCSCLLLGFLGLTVVQLKGHDAHIYICYALAYGTHFFLMATFFWLSVLAYDIWRTFRNTNISASRPSCNKFMWYCVYAFLMPTLMFIVTFSMDVTDVLDDDFKPGIGINKCWFRDKTAECIYFNGPMSILILFNLFFFIATAVKLWQIWKESAALDGEDSRTHNRSCFKDKQRFIMCLKLFVVMGVSWCLEIISWAVGGDAIFWYIPDFINLLQGLWIFILCVWMTRLRKVLLRQLLPHRLSKHLIKQSEHQDTRSSEVSEAGVISPAFDMTTEVQPDNKTASSTRSVEMTKM